TIVSAKFTEKDPYGESWDGFGGAPEPKICAYAAVGETKSTTIGCTTMKSDTFSPFYFETFEAEISSLEKLCFSAYDVDVSADDYADGACWENWVGLVKAGGYSGSLYDGFVQIDFTIAPKW
ncbi:MAG: hypothetical protein RIT45_4129, partial [Pseudomonadota bacterium]